VPELAAVHADVSFGHFGDDSALGWWWAGSALAHHDDEPYLTEESSGCRRRLDTQVAVYESRVRSTGNALVLAQVTRR
jgi:hypothetical protein